MTNTTAYDYEAIEAAVMETDRGRWFLAEFSRRHRSADTHALLQAIHKLEAVIASHTITGAAGGLGGDLSAMAAALKSTEAEMRGVSDDRLADGGNVAAGKTAFEDVAARARNLAAGLTATAGALQAASTDLRQDPAVAARICGLDDDLARLEEHSLTQDVLSRRITKAMGLIARLQDHIRASLADADAAAVTPGAAPDDGDDLPSAGEISYFDADRELFAPAETGPAAVPAMAADDPENAPHLADMLDDVLAGMQVETSPTPLDRQASQAPPATEPQAPQTPQAPVAAPPAEPVLPETPAASADAAPAAAEAEAPAPAAAEAPKQRRVVIVRATPPAPPAAAEAAEVAAPSPPAAAATGPDALATPASTTPVPEPGPEAIMQMFTDAAAKYGAGPAEPPAETTPAAATAPPAVEAAPLETYSPTPDERRRIIVIRRASSSDTPIPLEDSPTEAPASPDKH